MFLKINEVPAMEIMPGFKGRFIHSEKFTSAFWEIDAGSVLPEHTHIHEQTTQVLEGEMEFTVAGETRVLRTGDFVVIPSNVPHCGKALTACKVSDVFCPVREDYK